MAQIIPKNVLEDIRFRNDIADVIGSFLTLRKAGSSFKALCPFHKEKTPSFHVNPQRQIFHCFGCGEGGDVFGFIMKYENVDFAEAVRILADRAGVPLQYEQGDGTATSDKQKLYEIHEEIARFYQRCLQQMKSAGPAREYLRDRDLDGDTAADFLIGYAPNRWDAVIQWGRKHKVSEDMLEKAGLIVKNERGGQHPYYDRFRNRLMFPIRNEQSRVIGFSGRRLGGDDEGAKYVNSPETLLFKKSRVLYALDKARRPMAESREAIVCEGQIDVIRCHQAGFVNAVAAQGTAFTEDHTYVLRRYADSVLLVFDSDKAGQDAAIKAARIFMGTGLAVRAATLPDGEDPDSFIRKRGADAFARLMERAQSAVQYQIAVLSERENSRSEIGVMRIARAVLETVACSPNAVQRARLIQEAAQQLGIPGGALQDELRRGLQKTSRRRAKAAGPVSEQPARPVEEVRLCEHLAHAIDYPEMVQLVLHYLPVDRLADADCRAIVEASCQAVGTGRTLQEVIREHYPDSEKIARLAAAVQMAPAKTVGDEASPVDAVKDLILAIWRRSLELEKRNLPDDDTSLARRQEITTLRHGLKDWSTGSAIIEVELDM